MDKVVIFDWGGVVENHEDELKEFQDAKVRVIKRYNSNLTAEEIINRWSYKLSDNLSLEITNKKEDIEHWVARLQKNMNIHISYEDFKKTYEEEFAKITYYKDVVEYTHSLKNKCKIAILSNLTLFDKKRINDQYDLNQFDYVYLSFEIGMRKPCRNIYEYVLKDLNVRPENILFIDDENNIKTAGECGWRTCQAFGYELDKIKKDVDNFLEQKNNVNIVTK